MALMLMAELGWTTANPPETIARQPCLTFKGDISQVILHRRTEELLAAATVLDDLNQTGLQLLNGGNVVGEDTHLSGLGGDVDLNNILGLVDGLLRQLARFVGRICNRVIAAFSAADYSSSIGDCA